MQKLMNVERSMSSAVNGTIQTAVSDSFDPQVAAQTLADGLDLDKLSSVIFFCSPNYDLHALATALNDAFSGLSLIGCTTAGEISTRGITTNTISAVGLPSDDFVTHSVLLSNLSFADENQVAALLQAGIDQLEASAIAPIQGASFAFSLLDGLSIREEIMLPVMQSALGDIPLFGGSAADAMDFRDTYVFYAGAFHAKAAVVLLVNTHCPFEILSSNHFAGTDEKLVVTRADPEQRVVLELNAEPAAPEYCRVMGLSLDDLSTPTFASHPLGVQLGEHMYTRSIREMNDDLSLTFFCAIDVGVVLTKLRDTGMLAHIEAEMSAVCERIGEPQIVIACDCIHRHHEADAKGILDDLSGIYRRYNMVGFNTYGEQFNGMHVNHSFTGIAIGNSRV